MQIRPVLVLALTRCVITAERLEAAINKLSLPNSSVSAHSLLTADSRVLLRDGENCHWVSLQDIYYFESTGNHTHVVWSENKATVYRALSKIEERLPSDLFFRANRQQILNVHQIKEIDPWFNGGYKLLLHSEVDIEESRRHAARFKDLMGL